MVIWDGPVAVLDYPGFISQSFNMAKIKFWRYEFPGQLKRFNRCGFISAHFIKNIQILFPNPGPGNIHPVSKCLRAQGF
jgi:hypothetical protein